MVWLGHQLVIAIAFEMVDLASLERAGGAGEARLWFASGHLASSQVVFTLKPV